MDAPRPKVCQSFRAPAHKGSEGRVTGVDFVGKYSSSASNYTIVPFALNARNESVFPRLSAIATVWRRYYFKSLRFHLFGIAAATQRGYTAMSSLVTDDLATLITPTTESQILNQEQVAIGRPWSYVVHVVNLGGLGLEWYTCDSGDGSSEFGEYIGRAFLGIPQTTTESDIEIQVYVEYDVEFCQRVAATLDPIASCPGGLITSGTPTTSNILGSAAIIDSGSLGFAVDSAGIITFTTAGTYLVSTVVNGASITAAPTQSELSSLNTNFVSTRSINVGWLNASVGTTLGPWSISAASVTTAFVRIGSAPTGSLALTDTAKVDDDDFLDQVARLKLRIKEAKLKE